MTRKRKQQGGKKTRQRVKKRKILKDVYESLGWGLSAANWIW